jgi:hypothetical protein
VPWVDRCAQSFSSSTPGQSTLRQRYQQRSGDLTGWTVRQPGRSILPEAECGRSGRTGRRPAPQSASRFPTTGSPRRKLTSGTRLPLPTVILAARRPEQPRLPGAARLSHPDPAEANLRAGPSNVPLRQLFPAPGTGTWMLSDPLEASGPATWHCQQGSRIVSADFTGLRWHLTYCVAPGIYSFGADGHGLSAPGSDALDHGGLDLCTLMFAPCLLGCPGTPR